MDEEYILVSKETIKKYKEEISNLKKQLKNKPVISNVSSKSDNSNVVDNSNIEKIDKILETKVDKDFISENNNDIAGLIKHEFMIENNKIMKYLEDIKELNKSTLDNLLINTKQLDDRLENMIDTISELVNTLSRTIDTFTTSNEFDLKMLASKIDKIPLVQSQVDDFNNNGANQKIDVKDKLQEILMFMKNLRVLLSYVKPNDMSMNKLEIK